MALCKYTTTKNKKYVLNQKLEHFDDKHQKIPKGQSKMDNPETLAA
jgi:hypothetical protein